MFRIDIETLAPELCHAYRVNDASYLVYKHRILEDGNNIIEHAEQARTVSEQLEDEGDEKTIWK